MKGRFIHCADIHLGAQPLKIEERYNDFFDSFSSIIDYAIKNDIKLLLISGDLFHIKNINSKTLLKTTQILQRAKENNIQVLVIEGNHDKAFYVDEDSWLIFLKESGLINLLTHKLENGRVIDLDFYENECIQVFGVGYLGSATEDHIEEIKTIINKKKDSKKYTVLMLHAAVDKLTNSDLASVKKETINELAGCVNYLALGHIHSTYGEGFIHNPGSIERIRIDESPKPKGFYDVIVEDRKEVVNFIELDTRKYVSKTIKFDNNNAGNEVEFIEYLKNYDYSELKEGSVLVINLHGNLDWNTLLVNFEALKEELKSKYNLLYVEINNYINIFEDELNSDDIDFAQIERNEIKKELENYYSNINIDNILSNTVQLKDSIINKESNDSILEVLYQSEVFNEN